MSSAIKAAGTFSDTPQSRLEKYLERQPAKGEVMPLTPDASTRVYFRVPWKRGTAVAAVYPDAFDETVQPYLDVTRLFLESNLPVPEIFDVDGAAGIIIQEDLGDNQLCKVFETASEDEREALLEQAIEIIARIQAATTKAFERDSICSRLAFDEPKLAWELNFFFEHYFGSYRRENLMHGQAAELKAELNDIAAELAARPRVMCHRDFHSFNLILNPSRRLRIIDHQDARMGPATYDLVSLCRSRHVLAFAGRDSRTSAVPPQCPGTAESFSIRSGRLFKGIQINDGPAMPKGVRHFSYQTGVRRRIDPYERFINPMLVITLHAAEWLDRFPVLQRMIRERIMQ